MNDPPKADESPGALLCNPTTDKERARELYKYFRPPAARATADPAPPDTVLTAHAQLVAWRFNAQRAMVSLIDFETQYFIAESTKTLHLDDALQYEHPDDAIWAGCIDVPKAGRLCEHTIAALPPPDGGPACFEVLDLSKDDRFNTLSFIADEPHFRYYCGVPIRTRKGIAIGSIFVLDNKVREPATHSEKHFLSVVAENVVQHLELMKDKRERHRSTYMNKCLSSFVDPDQQPSGKHRKRPSPHSSLKGSEKARSAGASREGSNSDGDSSDSDAGSRHGVEDDEYRHTFQRAAVLMREALDLEDGGGGVVFLDTAAAVKGRLNNRNAPAGNSDASSGQDSEREEQRLQHQIQVDSKGQPEHQQNGKPIKDPHRAHTYPAEIIAYASHLENTNASTDRENCNPLSPAELSSLIKRHPRGRLFTFEGNDMVSSSSDEQTDSVGSMASSKRRKPTVNKAEAALLKKSFPTARQVIFLPLWNSTTTRWSACFVYNCSPYRNFSKTPDFLYCIAFRNCIMAEVARLATIIADQQKSDFIGSISHELRSPLHGILASCEFLGDTECSSFQRSLVDTADSCARTLLDTINMVLDYSKINTFERNTTKTRKSKKDTLATNHTLGFQSHLNIYSDVDLAAITEEVVEGVATGHVFRDSLVGPGVHDIDEPVSQRRKRSSVNAYHSIASPDIIVDIPARDWIYWSQAGALRRIVMNLFGNAMKYTKTGYIHVKLEAADVAPTQASNICAHVTLSVTDTGQGISPEYMRTKLFTPFAQESSLTPGTGLGLSLVKSIVTMLDGEIEIESTVGVGTKVMVRLPMSKGTFNAGYTSGPGSTGSVFERMKDDSIELVKAHAGNRTIAIYESEKQETQSRREASSLMDQCVTQYMRDWYGFTAQQWSATSPPDIIIVDESDLQSLIRAMPELMDSTCRTTGLVLCQTISQGSANDVLTSGQNFEEIRYPFGPYKLAKALRLCFEKYVTHVDVPMTSNLPEAESIDKGKSQRQMESVITAVNNTTLADMAVSSRGLFSVRAECLDGREPDTYSQVASNLTDSRRITDDSACSDALSGSPFLGNNTTPADDAIPPAVKNEFPSPDQKHHRPTMHFRRTISATRQEMNLHDNPETNAMSLRGAQTNNPEPHSATLTYQRRSPRMLLVDDNKINLKLLQTFMRKRKYTAVTSAEDGLEAVNAYTSLLNKTLPEPPDIILMDISMPVMNGFEATRRIREIERESHDQFPSLKTSPSCLIIALTGLASGRDQSEAFTSGFDLYITKPVSFAEISRLLDNWEVNSVGATRDEVRNGAVTAG